MFFFLVGGIDTQAARVIKERAAQCIRCGSYADLVECERVLKLFFVPVRRWPAKNAALSCRTCSFLFPESLAPPQREGVGSRDALEEEKSPQIAAAAAMCAACGREVLPEFRFCPFCGSSL